MADDHSDLFRRAVSGTKPLRSERRAAPPQNKPVPKKRTGHADESEVLRDHAIPDVESLQADSTEYLRFQRPSVGRRSMRKLARGGYGIRAEIDLHGMTVAEAKPRLTEFIASCMTNGQLCVRIVHGKGHGSGDRGPVLKRSVNHWLRQWDSVLAFVPARQVDGGTGAVYVLLKRD